MFALPTPSSLYKEHSSCSLIPNLCLQVSKDRLYSHEGVEFRNDWDGTEDELFFDARDWEKEEVKSQLNCTKTEVTELKKKATSWEKEARDVRKQNEKERKLKMEAVHQQRTVEREMRTLRRELETQLREISIKRNADISDLRKVIDGKCTN